MLTFKYFVHCFLLQLLKLVTNFLFFINPSENFKNCSTLFSFLSTVVCQLQNCVYFWKGCVSYIMFRFFSKLPEGSHFIKISNLPTILKWFTLLEYCEFLCQIWHGGSWGYVIYYTECLWPTFHNRGSTNA